MLTVYKQHDYIGLSLLLDGADSSKHKQKKTPMHRGELMTQFNSTKTNLPELLQLEHNTGRSS